MTPSYVAKQIGCHPNTIRLRIRDGTLKADKSPVSSKRHHIHRDSLIRWLLDAGWSGAQIRKMFPMPGPICLIGMRPELTKAFVAELPYLSATSLFMAAVERMEYSPWALVVDVPNIGTREVCRDLSAYRLFANRPLLIGIHGDDDDGRCRDVFDITIADTLPIGKIAQRIRAVRPWRGR